MKRGFIIALGIAALFIIGILISQNLNRNSIEQPATQLISVKEAIEALNSGEYEPLAKLEIVGITNMVGGYYCSCFDLIDEKDPNYKIQVFYSKGDVQDFDEFKDGLKVVVVGGLMPPIEDASSSYEIEDATSIHLFMAD